MSQQDKIRVAVLYGGRSPEHEVSLQSAANVIKYLDPNRFEVIPLGIDKQGNWHLGKDIFVKSLAGKQVPQFHHLKIAWFTPEWINKQAEFQTLDELAIKSNEPIFDVVFPAVHGVSSEDGTLQGLLELANLPYVGCGVLSSAICMDKDVAKRLAREAGLSVAPYIVIKQTAFTTEPDIVIQYIEKNLAYPLFVKPANTGSSIGITKVKQRTQLAKAIDLACQFDSKILIEKSLENIYELEIAVLESLTMHSEPIVSEVGEIKPRHEFYSYEAKYLDESGADLLIPAPIPEEIKQSAQKMAKRLFNLLECEGMARIDLFYDKDAKQIYFNEINTLPGFTKISMYPKLMGATGISYSNLLTHLVELALKKYKTKSQLKRSYAD